MLAIQRQVLYSLFQKIFIEVFMHLQQHMQGNHPRIHQLYLRYYDLTDIAIIELAVYQGIPFVPRNKLFVKVATLPALLCQQLFSIVVQVKHRCRLRLPTLKVESSNHRKNPHVHLIDLKLIDFWRLLELQMPQQMPSVVQNHLCLSFFLNFKAFLVLQQTDEKQLLLSQLPALPNSNLSLQIGSDIVTICSKQQILSFEVILRRYPKRSDLVFIDLPGLPPKDQTLFIALLYNIIMRPFIFYAFVNCQRFTLTPQRIAKIRKLQPVVSKQSFLTNTEKSRDVECLNAALLASFEQEGEMKLDQLIVGQIYQKDLIFASQQDDGFCFADESERVSGVVKDMLEQDLAVMIAVNKYFFSKLTMSQEGIGAVSSRIKEENLIISLLQLQFLPVRQNHRSDVSCNRCSFFPVVFIQIFTVQSTFYRQQYLIMIINLRIALTFAVYFSKNMQTTPLTAVKQNLNAFLKARVNPQEFQDSFSAYQSYLLRTLQDNPDPHPLKIDLLDLTTLIYTRYRLPTQKLHKIHNKLISDSLDCVEEKGPGHLAKVFTMTQRVNKLKAIALFKKQKQKILTHMRQFEPRETLQLLNFLKEVKIDDPLIRETAIETLFSQIVNLNSLQVNLLLGSLAHSKKYINKDFFVRVGQRVLTLYRSGSIKDKELPGILASLSQIQANLHTRSVYVEQLDRLYETALPDLFSQAENLSDNLLNRLVSATRRSKYFDDTFLQKLTHITLKRQITQLSNDQPQNRGYQLSLRTFLNIVHTHAVFNFHQIEFKSYLKEVLKILMMKERFIDEKSFFKLLWSLCVLYQRHELSTLYPMIEQYISKIETVAPYEAFNIYYCYLYLRTACPQINNYREHIHKLMEGHFLQTKPSEIQMEVYRSMVEVGVPCIPEYNLNNLTCDIMIPQWKSLKNVIVQLHGFKHFCRNVKRLTGSNALKQKIIASQMYKYYYIAVDEWLIAQDKKGFVLDFLEHINEMEEKKAQEKPVLPPRTSTRVRGRPRSFRVSSSQSLLE